MTLAELQRRMGADIMRPLVGADDCVPLESAASYIRSNDRLTARERLEIYSRSYWYRLIDSMYEDYPGLRAVLGDRGFNRLVRAYLADCPSRSFTMRDLGSRLEEWLRANPEQARSRFPMALDMARLEWAHIEAWDTAVVDPLAAGDLARLDGDSRIGLQTHLQLLDLRFPVDEIRLCSNASGGNGATVRALRMRRPSERYLAVHRLKLSVFYKTISRLEFQVLRAIRDGRTLGDAIQRASGATTSDIETWFRTWAELGWLVRPSSATN